MKIQQKKIKSLERTIKAYKGGNLSTLCRIPKEEKKSLRIAIRREFKQFEGDIQGFVKYCIENTTKMSWEEFLKKGC